MRKDFFVHSFIYSFDLARFPRKWPNVASSLTWPGALASSGMPKSLHHPHPGLTLESRVLWTFKSTESLSMLLPGEGQDTAIISNLFSENSEPREQTP